MHRKVHGRRTIPRAILLGFHQHHTPQVCWNALDCQTHPCTTLSHRHSVNSMALMGCPLNNGTPSGSSRVGSKLLTSFCADERNHNDVTGRSASAVQAGGIQGQASSNVGSVSSNSSTSSNSSSGSLHLLLIKDFLKMLKQMDLIFFFHSRHHFLHRPAMSVLPHLTLGTARRAGSHLATNHRSRHCHRAARTRTITQ